MNYKEKLVKISKNIYELPKFGKMLVPCRIFVSESLLGDVEEKALQQISNVACLPGIQKYSMAMPDMHTGFGFPIGGVAGFDLDKGVISPGGVGYDINCLGGDSNILSSLGYNKKIKDFRKSYDNESLDIFNKEKLKIKSSKIELFMEKYSEKIIKIRTKSGNEILATNEHPVYTKDGMKKIEEIKEGEEILTYPFEGIKYEKPERKILISEKDIDNLDRSYTSKLQIKNKLKSLELLPLYSDNPKIPYLLKIIGFIFGDGSITIKNNNCQIGFYGERCDLSLIKKDLEKIGFRSFLHSRKRKHKIQTKYKYYEFERIEESLRSSSSSLAIILNLLGTPIGNKGKQEYGVPKWIINSVKWYKRLFLASLFGAELSSPKTMTNNKFNFYGPIYSMVKKNHSHGINFINQILVLLREFEIRSILIKYDKNEVDGKSSNRLRLMIYPDSKNLVKLFSKINYDYNIKKRKLANAAVLWLKQKEKILKLREDKMIEVRKLKKEGITKKKIISIISCKYVNKHFIDKAMYYSDYGKTGSRIAYCFISFNEFVEKNCFGEEGFIWDILESKKEKIHKDFVYDFTINNKNHNFIANGLVVSNCSVRLLKTNLTREDIKGKGPQKLEIFGNSKNKGFEVKEIIHSLFRTIPSGVGRGSKFQLTKQDLDDVLEKGAKWAVEKGYGNKEDLKNIEEGGCLGPCNPNDVSNKAKKRGIGQLGTLGSGNHFLELQFVDEVLDEKTAKKLGLKKDQVCIMVHCGSRGLGHQVAEDYIKAMEKELGWPDFDRELVNAPIKSKLGKEYFSAMNCAANFAFANKQIITHWIRENMKHYFSEFQADVIYDICHNIAKVEKHNIEDNGKKVKKDILIMRKGATRSFPNQPVILPGSMGTSSYLLLGTEKAMELSFGSTGHGAGRVKSRSQARKTISPEAVKKEMKDKGIELETRDFRGVVEEASEVYKDIDEVVKVSDETGIGKLVLKLKPMGVVKG